MTRMDSDALFGDLVEDLGAAMSYRAIADRLNSEGHRTRVTEYRDSKTGEKKTRGGKPFQATTVKRIYDRASD